jgi:crotonobetainyl-CoA:carnitine CoA-transferase CaiB-like acyl-CoA transferase
VKVTMTNGLLHGVRIVEVSMLGPAAITTALADLGADVIKIESPAGDYVRQMTWPIVEGVSLMHLHVNRGKRSVVIDLRTEDGVALFLDLVRDADVVVEAMRPGGLARRGLSFDRLREVNPRIVQCTISGYGATGPYRDLASHGIAYDAWAGIFTPETDANGHPGIPDHVSIGINAGPLFGALGILAAVIHARATGEGSELELAQSDAAAAFDWYRGETYRAYERPETEVTGNKSDDYVRREPAIAGMRGGVRYQVYESTDGHVLFMASEQHFWKKFCDAVERPELFDRWPGSQYGDHARGNTEMQDELTEIFRGRSTAAWVEFGIEVDVPIAPVNTPHTLHDDPQFRDRMDWFPADALGADQLPFPVKVAGREPHVPGKAPEVGEHTDAVLRDVLGHDDARIAALRASGAIT